MTTEPRTRVLIVDDSAVFRNAVRTTIESDPSLEVAGTAHDGAGALTMVERHRPQVVVMDVEMPGMTGIEALREMRARFPQVRVIMFSSLTRRGAAETIEALTSGAADYLAKPTGVSSAKEAVEILKAELLPRIRSLDPARRATIVPPPAHTAAVAPPAACRRRTPRPRPAQVVAIGTSTGGPRALYDVLSRLGGKLTVPMLIVQHMPREFTAQLAARLASAVSFPVREAADGEPLEAGVALVAPGGYHMSVVVKDRERRIHLDAGPPINFCRPSVDPMLESVARTFGPSALAVILTGMGRDGADGCRSIRDAGGWIIVQDESTSVVWGMPGAVATSGCADEIVPLNRVADRIATAIGGTVSNDQQPTGVR